MAALLLDDRAYEGQPDAPIRETVDFIFRGPGVVLAEDGLLENTGAALALSADAGGAQARKHLEDRLLNGEPVEQIPFVTASLRRHSATREELLTWLWGHRGALPWVQVAASLGAFAGLAEPEAQSLLEGVLLARSDSVWATGLLLQGGYDQADSFLLDVAVREINDGAAARFAPGPSPTPLNELLRAARLLDHRELGRAAARSGPGRKRTPNAGRRAARQGSPTAQKARALEALRDPFDVSSPDEWRSRLGAVAEAWGDGWVLRRAVSAVPGAVSLGRLATDVRDAPALAAALSHELGYRTNAADADWWLAALGRMDTGFDRREWAFALLRHATAPAMSARADDLSEVIDGLAPRHFQVLEAALSVLAQARRVRELSLQEPLRLGQVAFSDRALWLVRYVATDATRPQIDKKLPAALPALLRSGIADARSLVRIVGTRGSINFDSLRGARAVLPQGGWASDVKLVRMSNKLANEILEAPALWPADIVQRAVEHTAAGLAVKTVSLADVAAKNNWFAQ